MFIALDELRVQEQAVNLGFSSFPQSLAGSNGPRRKCSKTTDRLRKTAFTSVQFSHSSKVGMVERMCATTRHEQPTSRWHMRDGSPMILQYAFKLSRPFELCFQKLTAPLFRPSESESGTKSLFKSRPSLRHASQQRKIYFPCQEPAPWSPGESLWTPRGSSRHWRCSKAEEAGSGCPSGTREQTQATDRQ